MSSDEIVLSVKNLSKRFEIYDKPIYRLKQMLFGRFGRQYFSEFWAFNDISFNIRKGECVGVIGRNGAGKSTLLQILVGTLQPTTGSVEVKGRVAALLELGSGFDPEFTGRENVYMNAAILGLSREEIDHKFEEILHFSEIGDFIEQPVKNYSSGMMVRLAFSVQIMVEPDILIVDEALAVGDAAFQRKCFARMEQLMKKGTTLFLVTHDTETVKRLCSRVLFLRDKRCVFDGPAADGVALYMKYLFPAAQEPETDQAGDKNSDSQESRINIDADDITDQFCYRWTPEQKEARNSYGYGGGQITQIRIYGLNSPNILPETGKITIEVDASWDQEILRALIAKRNIEKNVFVGFGISNEKNVRIFGDNTHLKGIVINPLERKHISAVFRINFPTLKSGYYFLHASLSLGHLYAAIDLDWNDYAVCLVSESDVPVGFISAETQISVK